MPAKVKMVAGIRPTKRAKNLNKRELSAAPPKPEVANHQVCYDPVAVMEDVMKFFLQRAIETSDEEAAKKLAKDANRAFKALARYHPLYNRLWRRGFDMRDLRQARALLEALSAIAA